MEPSEAILNNIKQVLHYYLGEESETVKQLVVDIERYGKALINETLDTLLEGCELWVDSESETYDVPKERVDKLKSK